jgi:hypothetical protein
VAARSKRINTAGQAVQEGRSKWLSSGGYMQRVLWVWRLLLLLPKQQQPALQQH